MSSLLHIYIGNKKNGRILQIQFMRLIADAFHSAFHIAFKYNILQIRTLNKYTK
jgi:hypothetical protein